ncbi:MAG: YIP1 family protein [Aestuariivita sp.]|nr:YIP1 family protein [Aestuariivita sp.]
MPLARDIVATYLGPKRVMQRLTAMGRREDLALIFLMIFCFFTFISQLPKLVRQSHISGEDLSVLMAGTLMASVILLPLLFYFLAAIVQLTWLGLGKKCTGYHSRLALFWSLLATTPVILLYGLLAGLLGPSYTVTVVGIFWFALFCCFWILTFGVSGEKRHDVN